MTRNEALAAIAKELSTGANAMENGNNGMGRVCARRAAGVAISAWVEQQSTIAWSGDVMRLLHSVQNEHSLPEEVREAAMRLTTKITEQFTSKFSTNPLEDSNIIIHFFMGQI